MIAYDHENQEVAAARGSEAETSLRRMMMTTMMSLHLGKTGKVRYESYAMHWDGSVVSMLQEAFSCIRGFG